MKRWHVIVVVVLFAIGCSVVLWRTESFQQRFFPETYWDQKVNELKQKVATSEFMLGNTALELEKKRRTVDLEVAQKTNISKLVGMDLERANKKTVEQVSQEIKGLTDTLRIIQEMLEKNREKLAAAEKLLARHAK